MNDKAKTTYFIHILEFNSRLSCENQNLLKLISDSLDDISRQQQDQTDLLQLAAQAKQKIYDLIRSLKYDFLKHREEFADLRSRISAKLEPSLWLPDFHNLTIDFSYQFGVRYTSFIRRENEMTQLWDFMNGQPQRKVLWWIVIGKGGMGKSRLALEFCLEVQSVNRHAGFVENSQLTSFAWSHWRPEKPTLLVIDYVESYAKDIEKLIEQLSKNAKLFDSPIRILLLERELKGEWWDALQANMHIVECSYESGNPKKVLKLQPFTQDDHWQLIEEVHRKQEKPTPESKSHTLHNLYKLNKEGRPLYTFLAAMALANGEDIKNWDVNNLLDNLLNREEKSIWSQHHKWCDERFKNGHKNLLLLTTLTRGLSKDQLKQIFQINAVWLPEHQPDNSLYKYLSSIRQITTEDGRPENIYEGLQPDLVGEFYILKRVSQLMQNDFNGAETIDSLLTLAWRIKPERVWWNIWLIASDFPHYHNRAAYNLIIKSQPPSDLSEPSWVLWSYLQFNLLHPNFSWQDKSVCYENLKIMARRYKHNHEIVMLLAMGSFNLITLECKNQRWQQAELFYKDLKSLAVHYSRNENIVLQLANATFNLVYLNSKQQRWQRAELFYEDLKSLAKSYSYNEKIVLQLANAALDLIDSIGDHQRWQQAETCYEDLKNLAKEYPRNEDIALQLAKGAFNMTSNNGRHQRWQQAESCYEDLQSLAIQYNQNEEIVLRIAKGAFNLVLENLKHQRWQQAETCYAYLQGLPRYYKHNEEIMLQVSEGTYSMLLENLKHQRWQQTETCYKDLLSLVSQYNHDAVRWSNLSAQ